MDHNIPDINSQPSMVSDSTPSQNSVTADLGSLDAKTSPAKTTINCDMSDKHLDEKPHTEPDSTMLCKNKLPDEVTSVSGEKTETLTSETSNLDQIDCCSNDNNIINNNNGDHQQDNCAPKTQLADTPPIIKGKDHGSSNDRDDEKVSIYKVLALKLKKDLAKTKEALLAYQQAQSELNQKLELSLKENVKLTTKYSHQVRNFNSLQSEYDKVLDESEALKKKIKAVTLNKSEDEIKELKSLLKQKEARVFELESKASDLLLQVEQKDQLKEKLRDMNVSHQDVDNKYKEVSSIRDRLTVEVSQHKETIESLQTRCREQSSHIKELDSNLFCERHNFEIVKSSYEAKIKNLKEQLTESQEEVQSLMSKFDDYRCKAGQIIQQSNMGQTNSVRTFEAERMRKLEATNSQLQDAIEHLEKKLRLSELGKSKLEMDIQRLIKDQQDNQDRLDRLAVLESSCEHLRKENTNLNRALDDLSRRPNILVDQVTAQYESKLKESKNEYEQIIKDLHDSLERFNQEDNQSTSKITCCSDNDATNTPVGEITPAESEAGEDARSGGHHTAISSLSLLNPISRLWPIGDTTIWPSKQDFSYSNDEEKHRAETEQRMQQLQDVQHLNHLLSDQVSALKDEIRRLQLGNERLEIAEKLEYLKNIIVKFVTLEGKAERQRLIPVLATMLKLSPEEQSRFDAAASINDKPRYFGL